MGWLSDLWRYGLTSAQRRTSRAAEHYARSIAAYERELHHITTAEAERQIERLLDSPAKIRVHPWTGRITVDLTRLAPGQQSIFRRVRRLEARNGEPYVDAAELRPYEWDASLTCIGVDSEHVSLVVRPGEDPVYVVDETETLALSSARQFPTLAHWVLWLERSDDLLHGREGDQS